MNCTTKFRETFKIQEDTDVSNFEQNMLLLAASLLRSEEHSPNSTFGLTNLSSISFNKNIITMCGCIFRKASSQAHETAKSYQHPRQHVYHPHDLFWAATKRLGLLKYHSTRATPSASSAVYFLVFFSSART